jgi:DNA-directed RNA polymerase specialized sigma24 family protein
LEELSRILATLAQEEQVVVTLHLIKGQSFEEIGKMLSISPISVEKVYRVARSRIIKELGG